jgi:hypothetical protein
MLWWEALHCGKTRHSWPENDSLSSCTHDTKEVLHPIVQASVGSFSHFFVWNFEAERRGPHWPPVHGDLQHGGLVSILILPGLVKWRCQVWQFGSPDSQGLSEAGEHLSYGNFVWSQLTLTSIFVWPLTSVHMHIYIIYYVNIRK